MASPLPIANQAAREPGGLVQVEKLGLTVLYEPKRNAPKADVVFVHGLQGHPQRTWRYKGTVAKTTAVHENPLSKIMGLTSNPNRRLKDMTTTGVVYWPLELLPGTHEDIRILTYGYDSHVSNWFTGPANKMTIATHGRSLLNDLARERQDSRGRPMIFVAHSLGGLVVKEALIEARKQKYHNHLNEIYSSCEAIIFFGTPHRGSGAAKWAVLLGNIASAAQFDTNIGIARDLDPSGGSDKLEELRRDFNDILEEGKIKIHTFQEAFGIAGLKIVSSKIVPDESSSFDSRKFEIVDIINANHMDMCRFGSIDDVGYKKFVGALANVLSRIDATSKEIAERMRAERKEELSRRLDFAERQAREHQLSSGDRATFDWIWSTGSSGTTFVDWLSSGQGLFWISGKPGSGKSTLMSYLAGDRKTLSFLRKSTKLPWTIIRFFFDFRAGKGTANNLEGLLRTLLFQLVQNVPELTTRVLEFAKDRFGESQVLDWPETKLRQSLLEGLRACPCNVCIFVDGLDEYEGNMLDLFKVLADIDDSCGSLSHVVKLCLASRPEPLLTATLQESAGFRMQDHNFKGIQEYVRSTLKYIRTAKGDDVFTNLSSEIAERSEGVFLWARLAMNDLIDGHVTGDTQGELLERLKRVPRELHDVYSRIFIRLPGTLKEEANTILLLVCGAKRTLWLRELYIAVKIARKEDHHDDDDDEHVGLPPGLLKAFRRRVLAKTGGLLEIVDRNGLKASRLTHDASDNLLEWVWEVKLIHETVRPFIESNQGVIFCPPRLGNAAAPRSLWLEVCVAAAQEAIPPLKLPDGKKWSEPLQKLLQSTPNRIKQHFPLAEYALVFLFDHARDLEMLDGLSSYKFLESIMLRDLYLLHAAIPLGAPAYGEVISKCVSKCVWCGGKISSYKPSWMWAAIHGLAKYCKSAFAEENKLDTDDKNVLKYAMNIYKSNTKVHDSHLKANLSTISLLVEHKVQVNDSHIFRALKTAPPQVLNLLLQDHSSGKLRLKASGGEIVGPFWVLMCEEYNSSYFRRTVDYLVRRGESLNVNCEPAGTALHAPLWSLSVNILWRYEVLLKKGADPNISGPAGTPLRLAWKRAHSGRVPTFCLSQYQGLMKLLLDYGAIIDWVDEDGVAPTEKEIRAYCDLSGAKILAFSGKESLKQSVVTTRAKIRRKCHHL